MASKRKQTSGSRVLTVPRGTDRRVWERLHRRWLATLARRHRVSEAALLRSAKIRATASSSLARVLGPKLRQAYTADLQKVRRLLDAKLPMSPGRRPPFGGNPKPPRGCRAAPYDFDYLDAAGRPLGERGTADAKTGKLTWDYHVPSDGLDWAFGYPMVGIVYTPQSVGTMVATVNATLLAGAHDLANVPPGGYAQTGLQLTVYVGSPRIGSPCHYEVIYSWGESGPNGDNNQWSSDSSHSSAIHIPIDDSMVGEPLNVAGAMEVGVTGLWGAYAKFVCSMTIDRICVSMD